MNTKDYWAEYIDYVSEEINDCDDYTPEQVLRIMKVVDNSKSQILHLLDTDPPLIYGTLFYEKYKHDYPLQLKRTDVRRRTTDSYDAYERMPEVIQVALVLIDIIDDDLLLKKYKYSEDDVHKCIENAFYKESMLTKCVHWIDSTYSRYHKTFSLIFVVMVFTAFAVM